jgi:hypothetical protein
MHIYHNLLAHPNVVSLLRTMNTIDHTYAIIEHCPEGYLLSNVIEDHQYVGEDILAKNVFLQIRMQFRTVIGRKYITGI